MNRFNRVINDCTILTNICLRKKEQMHSRFVRVAFTLEMSRTGFYTLKPQDRHSSVGTSDGSSHFDIDVYLYSRNFQM